MITEIKKISVETLFWPACPVDDDYGFNAIMNASVIDKKFQNDHAVYLHEAYKELCTTKDIKEILIKKAIRLTELLYDVDVKQAKEILKRTM